MTLFGTVKARFAPGAILRELSSDGRLFRLSKSPPKGGLFDSLNYAAFLKKRAGIFRMDQKKE